MKEVLISGHSLYCEVSQPNNPRPLVPKELRTLILNLNHHQDHPNPKETLRRIAQDYYWPSQRRDVEGFCNTCHPCQLAKQSSTVNPGTGLFPVPDQRFSAIHLDVVGPLPESEDGKKYMLTAFCRTTRWFEAYPMAQASSMEVCMAFMQWVERFGVPKVAISDNGNTFISNLYKDVMRTFGIEIKFTSAYHAATNGAIERRHQTLKNSLKACLVDMGDKHGAKWTSALPWVLLGKRAALQPDLDASPSMLAFGRSPDLPGQLLSHPGPPLNNTQTKSLLEELYKMDNKPAIQTTALAEPIDISYTENITHVYVKVDEPKGLNPRFEGPYKVISRPCRNRSE